MKNCNFRFYRFYRYTDTRYCKRAGDIQVVAMAAGSNISLLEAQMREFKPSLVSVWDEKKASDFVRIQKTSA